MTAARSMTSGIVELRKDDLSIEIDLICGGSVRSFRWNEKDVLRPTAPKADDPLEFACFPLAPFSNRIGGPFTFNARTYDLPANMPGVPHPIHGFAWQKRWQLLDLQNEEARIILVDEESPWPQPYTVEQRFKLSDQGLLIDIALTNIGVGPMPAGIGLHPYFLRNSASCNIRPGQMWVKDRSGLPEYLTKNHPLVGGLVQMHEIRLDHSFSEWDGLATIEYPESGFCVSVQSSSELRELVIYSPEADYFCIEPVSHVTNAALAHYTEMKRGWTLLQPGQTLSGNVKLTIFEFIHF